MAAEASQAAEKLAVQRVVEELRMRGRQSCFSPPVLEALEPRHLLSAAPTFEILNAEGYLTFEVGDDVTIAYTLSDSDSNAWADFAFDTDMDPTNGQTAIATHVQKASGQRQVVWDTSSVDPGLYYLYAKAYDGENTTDRSYYHAFVLAAPGPDPIARVATSLGTFHVRLNRAAAPITVANFLTYAYSGFYDGLTFHRVESNFVIQGGGFTSSLTQPQTNPPIYNENLTDVDGNLHNTLGTIAMARTSQPHSATSQFFINVVNNSGSLDYQSAYSPGYVVFGQVVQGMDVVNAIRAVPVHNDAVKGLNNVPDTPVVIQSVTIVESGNVQLVTPAASTSMTRGNDYRVEWIGGTSTTKVQLWSVGPDGWTMIADNIPASQGYYEWDTTGKPHGWYCFGAQVDPGNGGAWYTAASPNWVHVQNPSNHTPTVTLTTPASPAGQVTRGQGFTIRWNSYDADGDSVHVSLWGYSPSTGWFQVPGAAWLSTPANGQGSFTWNTSTAVPDWYSFSAHIFDGSAANVGTAPDFVHVVLPTAPTLTFLTPQAGSTVTRGNTFQIRWQLNAPTDLDWTLHLWGYNVHEGWFEVALDLDASTGQYVWSSAGTLTDWYGFGAWLGAGDVWVGVAADNWLHVL